MINRIDWFWGLQEKNKRNICGQEGEDAVKRIIAARDSELQKKENEIRKE